MKKSIRNRFFTFVIIVTSCFRIETFAQAPNWQWAKSSANASNNNTATSVTAVLGNEIVTGYFTSSSITFGSTILNNAGSTNGLPDVFLTKYDGSGNVLWAKSAGSGDYDYAFDVANDASGNVYMVGRFMGASITFGSTTLTNSTTGKTDIFIVKYDGSGNVLWAKSVGGNNDDGATDVATDASGNVFMTGWFETASITFGSTTLTNNSSGDTTDIFIVKYNSSGTVLWAKKAGGTNNDYTSGICTDASGNVLISGHYHSNPITLAPITLTNSGSSDALIAKYDANGNINWATKTGGSSADFTSGVAADASGNAYLTGYFSNFLLLGGTLASAGGSDIFIGKFNPTTGGVTWGRRAGGTNFDYSTGIRVDAVGNVYLTGYYLSGSATFDTISLTNPFATSTSDFFIAKYNTNGNVYWAKSAGGSGQDHSTGLCIDNAGNGYLTGYYNSPTMVLGTTTLTSSSFQNVFLAKLSGITGMEEVQEAGLIEIYPNPSHGEFVVRSSEFIPDEIEILNVVGEKIYEDKFINNNFYIVNQNLPQGIYFVRLTIGESVVTKKIIVYR
jgi:hypothetical protein